MRLDPITQFQDTGEERGEGEAEEEEEEEEEEIGASLINVL